MGSIKKYLLREPLALLARIGWRAPFVRILKSAISEYPANRAVPGEDRITVLALSPEGFRGDLEALAASGACRVLVMDSTWQYRFLYFFYREGLRVRDYLKAPADGEIMRSKQALQAFYRSVLPELYRHFGIDCVISYHIRMPADVDWGVASHDVGAPYVVLYREGLFASSPALQEMMAGLFDRFGFWGTHLVVHNESCRQLCIDTGLAGPDTVSALGCMRMDGFLQRIAQQKRVPPPRPKVALFPTSLEDGGPLGLELWPFFSGVHVALARLAEQRPDVDFVFKPKPKDYPRWRQQVDSAFAEAGIDAATLPNLVMDAELDAQDLILESSVVCGINSTTILEAAMAGKPVVVPFFQQLREQAYADSIKFHDAFAYLDVAEDSERFAALVEERLARPEVSDRDMAGRRAMFAKYVSDPDGGALQSYLSLLKRLVAEARARQGCVASGAAAARGEARAVGARTIQGEQRRAG